MDYVGQSDKEGPKMSQVQVVKVDLCHNLPDPDSLNTEHRNLNEAETLSQTHIPSRTMTQTCLSQNEQSDGCELLQNRLNLNGVDQEQDEKKVMKEVEDTDESEESSSLIRCQSPDTPMTDSSYSETGSLLETPYPFSPGTSPEPTSPIISVVSPETAHPISVLECNPKVNAQIVNIGSVASTVGPISCTKQSICTSGPIDFSRVTASATVPTGTICIPQSTVAAGAIDPLTGPITSSTQSVYTHGPACSQGLVSSCAEPLASASEGSTATATAGTAGLTTATVGLISSDATPITPAAGPTTSTSGTIAVSGPTPTTEPIPKPALLVSLEQLGERADDAHLPQYLHQIAEAFVLQEDYQQAVWCIQLERLYHQRILDNLKTLQEQWESHCRLSAPDLATQLDTLTHICQTHNRPSARDAVCVPLDSLKHSTLDDRRLGGPPSSCASSHKAESEMEERTETDSSLSQNQPITSSASLTDSRHTVGADRDSKPELTDREEGDRKQQKVGGRTGYTTLVGAAGIHPHPNEEMERSVPTENQGGESEPLHEEEEEEEEEEKEGRGGVEAVAVAAIEEEDDEEEEEEEEIKLVCEEPLPEAVLATKAEAVVQQMLQEALDMDMLPEEAYDEELQEGNQEARSRQGHQEMEEEYGVEGVDLIRDTASLDDLAKLITVEEMSPASGLVSILKKRRVCVPTSPAPQPSKPPAKRRVRFKFPDDSYDQEVGSGDSCLLLFLLCFVTVVISVGGTALYCVLGDTHSTVCQDFSRNADFYTSQMQHWIAQIQHWFTPGS